MWNFTYLKKYINRIRCRDKFRRSLFYYLKNKAGIRLVLKQFFGKLGMDFFTSQTNVFS